MKISYNSPLVLNYALVCTLVTLLSYFIPQTTFFFSVSGGMSLFSPFTYLKLVSHIFGHANLMHLVGNFSIILMIGPALEEKYGRTQLALMMFVTALLTGILQMLFFSEGLLGASGIAFMMILLSSFVNVRSGEIPLTFILVALLYVGQEVISALKPDQVSQFAHIIGGFCGAMFGFAIEGKRTTKV